MNIINTRNYTVRSILFRVQCTRLLKALILFILKLFYKMKCNWNYLYCSFIQIHNLKQKGTFQLDPPSTVYPQPQKCKTQNAQSAIPPRLVAPMQSHPKLNPSQKIVTNAIRHPTPHLHEKNRWRTTIYQMARGLPAAMTVGATCFRPPSLLLLRWTRHFRRLKFLLLTNTCWKWNHFEVNITINILYLLTNNYLIKKNIQ